MDKPPAITIAEHFSALSDPRVDRTKDHLLSDILTIAICAVIARAVPSPSDWPAPGPAR